MLGLLIGSAGSGLLVRFLEGALYEVEPHDAPTFGAVAVLLGGVALLGSYLPARRAARVDPMTSLGEG